jgi:hypothetical protein
MRHPREDELCKGVDLFKNKARKIPAETIITSPIFTGTPFKPLFECCRIADIETESERKCYTVQKKAVAEFVKITDLAIQRA